MARNVSTESLQVEVFQLDDLPAQETRHRLEHFCLTLLETGQVTFRAPSAKHRYCVDGVIRLGTTTRTFTASSINASAILTLLGIIQDLLIQGKTATTREILYRMKDSTTNAVLTEGRCKGLITLASYLLGVTRDSLNLIGMPKGLYCGLNESNRAETCAVPNFRYLEDLKWIAERIAAMAEPPNFVLILEKFTVFHKLTQSRFPHENRCVVVTCRGFPDLSTRKFVSYLRNHLNLPCLGACDFNPHGLALLGSFSFGSLSMCGDAFRYIVPDLIVLGLSSQDALIVLDRINQGEFQSSHIHPLTPKDIQAIKALEVNAELTQNLFISNELGHMKQLAIKMDLDVMESLGHDYLFEEWLPWKIAAAIGYFSEDASPNNGDPHAYEANNYVLSASIATDSHMQATGVLELHGSTIETGYIQHRHTGAVDDSSDHSSQDRLELVQHGYLGAMHFAGNDAILSDATAPPIQQYYPQVSPWQVTFYSQTLNCWHSEPRDYQEPAAAYPCVTVTVDDCQSPSEIQGEMICLGATCDGSGAGILGTTTGIPEDTQLFAAHDYSTLVCSLSPAADMVEPCPLLHSTRTNDPYLEETGLYQATLVEGPDPGDTSMSFEIYETTVVEGPDPGNVSMPLGVHPYQGLSS